MIKFATRISRLEGTRYAKKALKILIEDDMKGHYNWFSQVIDIMKSNNLREDNVSNSEIKLQLTENYKTSSPGGKGGTSTSFVRGCVATGLEN